jgi:hypothetical protein
VTYRAIDVVKRLRGQNGVILHWSSVKIAVCSHTNFMFMSNAAISPWQIIKNIKAKSEAFKPSKSNLFEKQETTHEVSIFCKTNKKS